MKRYFITGTDTNCGKTYVTKKLIQYFSHAAAIKPIASGCINVDNQLINLDAQELKLNSNLTLEQINPWLFQLPVSPHIAARHEGQSLIIKEIAEYCMELKPEGIDTLFIEGAGGLMVPLNDHETWIDFLKEADIPVILVVGMKLGCINHALLTESVLKAYQINCAGWIANCIDPEMLAVESNIETLKNKLHFPLLATLPYGGDILDLKLH